MDWTLEAVPVPAADEDTTKAFYIEKLGFHLDYDRPNDRIRAGSW